MAEGDVLLDADPATLRGIADALDALAAREWGGVADASNEVIHLAERMPAGPPRTALETHLTSWRDFYYAPDDAGSRWLLRTVALGLRARGLVAEQKALPIERVPNSLVAPNSCGLCGACNGETHDEYCEMAYPGRASAAWALVREYARGAADAET